MTERTQAATAAPLRTTADVIEALGGIPAVAHLTNRGYKAVHNWRTYGVFPPKTYRLMVAALTRVGRIADPALWQMDEAH